MPDCIKNFPWLGLLLWRVAVAGFPRSRPRAARRAMPTRRGAETAKCHLWASRRLPQSVAAVGRIGIRREQCCIAKNCLRHTGGLATLCTAAMRLCRAVCFLGRFLPKLGGATSTAIFLPAVRVCPMPDRRAQRGTTGHCAVPFPLPFGQRDGAPGRGRAAHSVACAHRGTGRHTLTANAVTPGSA